jgi:hypothetical protein
MKADSAHTYDLKSYKKSTSDKGEVQIDELHCPTSQLSISQSTKMRFQIQV